MKKTAKSTDYAQRFLDRFFYTMFAPVLKAGRPKKKKPTIRELESRYIAVCSKLLGREMGKALEHLLGMVKNGEITAKMLAAMIDTVKKTVKASPDEYPELDRIRDLAYEIGKDGVKKPPEITHSTALVDARAGVGEERQSLLDWQSFRRRGR